MIRLSGYLITTLVLYCRHKRIQSNRPGAPKGLLTVKAKPTGEVKQSCNTLPTERGTTMQPATAPLTFNEARTLANIASRAKTLFDDGYTYEQFRDFPNKYHVESPKGALYTVDVKAQTCTCLCHDERDTCKHLQAMTAEVEAMEA